MNLLNIIPVYYPASGYGGPVKRVFHKDLAMSSMGYRIKVYTSDLRSPNSNVRLPYFQNIRNIEIFRFRAVHELKKYFFTPSILKKGMNIKSDLIHITLSRTFQSDLFVPLSRIQKKPVIFEPCGATSYKHGNIWAKKFHDAATFKESLRLANIVLVQCKQELREVHQFGVPLNRIKLVYTGVDTRFFQKQQISKEELGFSSDKKIILFVGRLNITKGISTLVRAFREIMELERNIHLVILGEDDGDWSNISQLISHLGILTTQYFWNPRPTYEEIRKYYSIADLVVIPSYQDNFPQVLLEAGAMGCPTIASNVGGIKEVIEDGKSGYLFSALSHKHLRDKIIRMLQNGENERINMGKKLQNKVFKQFDQRIYLKNIDRLYKNVFRERKR